MTGLSIFCGVALAALLGLRVLGRLRGGEAMLALAAVFVAAAGYSWQGNPGLAGAPAQDRARSGLSADSIFTIERTRLLHVYGEAGQWLVLADGLDRAGEDQAAVNVLARAMTKQPRDVALRIAFAHALFVVADHTMTPAVRLAFDGAKNVALADPSAAYFEGFTYFEGGDLVMAEKLWRGILAGLPPASGWRPILVQRLALLDMLSAASRR